MVESRCPKALALSPSLVFQKKTLPSSLSHSLIRESRRLGDGKGIKVVERVPVICIGDPIIHVEIRDRRCEARIALIEGCEGVH